MRDTGFGRSSFAPERLILAGLLQILFSIQSERQPMEQIDYNLMLRWSIGLGLDNASWGRTVFTKNRYWPLTSDLTRKGGVNDFQ